MYKKILMPVENSPYDDAIVDHVRELAKVCGSSIVLIHVADGWAARNIGQLKLRESEEMKKDREYIEKLSASLEADGLDAEALLASGDPASEIAQAATREGCDLIAMGTHGHKFIGDLVHGSVEHGATFFQNSGPACSRQLARTAWGAEVKTPRRAHLSIADSSEEPLTGAVEDYLKTIYALGRGSVSVATNDIAQRLDLAPASVSGMVRRLATQGLLTYERYRGVTLTNLGRRAALRTLRRHRVIEAYLSGALNYPWDRVHDEAERLEHAASDELVDRMAAAIGEPLTDPHGAPIPSREGHMDETEYLSLAELGAGYGARVVRVSDDDPEMLRYLGELEIVPGAELIVISKAPYEGPITLTVSGTMLAIGPQLAAQVMVEPLTDLEAPAH